jgi:hypothetical protein
MYTLLNPHGLLTLLLTINSQCILKYVFFSQYFEAGIVVIMTTTPTTPTTPTTTTNNNKIGVSCFWSISRQEGH